MALTNIGVWVCVGCGAEFPDRGEWEVHVAKCAKHPLAGWKCVGCGRRFSDKHALVDHAEGCDRHPLALKIKALEGVIKKADDLCVILLGMSVAAIEDELKQYGDQIDGLRAEVAAKHDEVEKLKADHKAELDKVRADLQGQLQIERAKAAAGNNVAHMLVNAATGMKG